jgi:hypothetical protein
MICQNLSVFISADWPSSASLMSSGSAYAKGMAAVVMSLEADRMKPDTEFHF